MAEQVDYPSVFLADETGAIYVSDLKDDKLAPGAALEVEGVTGAGEFAPVVTATRWKSEGAAPLPAARPVMYSDLLNGLEDSQWIEVRGIVRDVAPYSRGRVQADIMMDSHRIRIVSVATAALGSEITDCEVRIFGVCVSRCINHQWVAPWLLFEGGHDLVIEKPAPLPGEIPIRRIGELQSFDPKRSAKHRVRTAGILVLGIDRARFFLQDKTDALEVRTDRPFDAMPGDLISVSGFSAGGNLHPILEDAELTVIGRSPLPETFSGSVRGLLGGGSNGRRVVISAKLVDEMDAGAEMVLLMQSEGVLFQAHLPRENQAALAKYEFESKLELTGVCVAPLSPSAEPSRPYLAATLDFYISPDGVKLLQSPPWWSGARGRRIGIVLLSIIIASLAWMASLHWKIRRQTAHIQERAERQAVAEERNRIARDLHDTLTQNLAGVAFRLEAVRGQMSGAAVGAQEHLLQALKVVRHSLAEARRSVMNLRALALGQNDLLAAIEETVRPLISLPAPAVSFATHGRPTALPSLAENHLLRIAQEAITNALRHADATTVSVSLAFETHEVVLSVVDDGRGFDRKEVENGEAGHFGLRGIQERAAKLGAQLEIRRCAEKGTVVRVSLSGRPIERSLESTSVG